MNALNHRNQPIAAESFQPGVNRLLGSVPPPSEQSLAVADAPQRFRLLKECEVVGRGDFVENEQRGFEPWEGPTGFRADTYVRQIYRLNEKRSAGAVTDQR